MIVGSSLNWTLTDQTIKALFIDTGNKGFKTVNVIYHEEDIL